MKAMNIAIIGECMVELQGKADQLKQTFGGDTLNTALYLSRLTREHGVKTSYVTALGNDPFSADMMAKWQQEGIETSLIPLLDNKQPGLYYIETDETGERKFHYWRNDSAAKYLFDQPNSAELIEELLKFDAIYLSGISLAILTNNGRNVLIEFLEQFKAKGGYVFFDNNYRPKLWENNLEAMTWYLKVLNLTDTALLTFDDEQELYGDVEVEQCIKRTTEAGVKEIIIKRGAEDCIAVKDGESQSVAPRLIEKVVDTTAAGDSFSAGFLAKTFTGGTLVDAILTGHSVAGNVIQHPGAIIPVEAMPDLAL